MNKTTVKFARRSTAAIALLSIVGCIKHHPRTNSPATLTAFPATMQEPTTAPSETTTAPTTAPVGPATVQVGMVSTPVATGDLGTVKPLPGVSKKPKPFIAFPQLQKAVTLKVSPSTLLLEHASPDSPVPLSEYGNQPVFGIADFRLRGELSAAEVQHRLGPPAQLAVNDDPWLVYRLSGDQEIWLHFSAPDSSRLLEADVIRGAEDGYVRDRVFEAP